MRIFLYTLIPIGIGCGSDITCKLHQDDCVDELELWTCIDGTEQVWYEFSDGKQVACTLTDCAVASDEAAAYCNGVKWNPPENE